MRRERLGISGCDLLRLIVENQFSCPKKLDSMIFAPHINHFSAPKTFFQQQKGRRDVGFAGFWWFLAVQFHGCSFEQISVAFCRPRGWSLLSPWWLFKCCRSSWDKVWRFQRSKLLWKGVHLWTWLLTLPCNNSNYMLQSCYMRRK